MENILLPEEKINYVYLTIVFFEDLFIGNQGEVTDPVQEKLD